MSEGGCTPGPWICQPTDREGPDYGVGIIAVHLDGQGAPISSPTRGLVAAALPWPTEIDSGDMSRVEANARLIAAAPDLFEALRAFVAGADAGHVSVEVDRAARAALAKADGK